MDTLCVPAGTIANDGNILTYALMQLEAAPSDTVTWLEGILSAKSRVCSDNEAAVLLALHGALCTETGLVGLAAAQFARLLPRLRIAPQICIPLLADFARLTFAALQGHLLVQSDWQDWAKPEILDSPEGIFWAAEYIGALRGTGHIARAEAMQRAASQTLKSKEADPAMSRAAAHLQYQTGLLLKAQGNPNASEALRLAVEQLSKTYGDAHWMTLDARSHL